MKKQELLAKWQSIFASMNTPLLAAEFEKDITSLLSDEETSENIVLDIHIKAMKIDSNVYGLPVGKGFIDMFQEIVVKNLNNELD
jgi:hypothetical protein